MVSLFNGVAEESAGYFASREKLRIPESVLASLWRKRASRQEWFRTGKGRRVRVLYPGRTGTSAGPDFRDAVLEFEGLGQVQGDVEIHRRQQDWKTHGHQDDPNYNGVVLHAVMYPSPAATTLRSGSEAPVISLQPLFSDEILLPPAQPSMVWELLTPLGYPQPTDGAQMARLLERAGDARFLARSKLFQKFFQEQDPEQSLYEGLFESLGYRQNQQPFLKLANCAPYSMLDRAARRLPPGERAVAMESWLLRLAGLQLDRQLSGINQAGISRPVDGWNQAMSQGEWHCFRVRPANHPRRRIGGAARLLARFMDVGLLEGLQGHAAVDSPKSLTEALTVSEGGTTYIGAPRAREIAVNVVLPFYHGLATEQGENGQTRAYLGLYAKFGKLPDNEITREMVDQLFDPSRGNVVATARHQQGLIHLQRLLSGAAN